MKNFNLTDHNYLNVFLKIILYFALSLYPIYIFGSGTVQIGHFLLIIFSMVVLIKIGMPKDKYFYTFLIFLIYCFSINIFYFAYDLYIFKDPYRYVFIPPDLTYLRNILFITFNFVLVISIISYLNYQKKLNIIFYGVLTAILIILFPVIYKFLLGLPFYRYMGFFNNPNQLGYYSICCFSLIYLFYRNSYISYYLMTFLLAVVTLFSILTLSKASYIPLLICIVFALKPYNYKYSKIIDIIILSTIVLAFIILLPTISEMSFFKRITNILNESDTSLSHRGYLVFLEGNSLQAIFGMGVKNVFKLHTYEIHSTFGMILTSFGFIGFLIFFTLMIFWILDIKNSYGFRAVICVCGPSLLYGLTHNGLRFSMFWIMFAVTIALSKNFIKQKKFKDL